MTIAAASTLKSQGRGASIFQWVNAGSLTVSDQTTSMVGVELYSQATLYLSVASISNTSADFYVQKLLPDGLTWQDLGHFAQVTGASNQVMNMVSGGNLVEVQQSAAMAVSTVKSVPFGAAWRINVVIVGAGTTVFSLWGEFLI